MTERKPWILQLLRAWTLTVIATIGIVAITVLFIIAGACIVGPIACSILAGIFWGHGWWWSFVITAPATSTAIWALSTQADNVFDGIDWAFGFADRVTSWGSNDWD